MVNMTAEFLFLEVIANSRELSAANVNNHVALSFPWLSANQW